MKKYGFSLLIIIFLWQVVGNVLYFSVEQMRIRKAIKTRMKSTLKESELATLSFTSTEFEQLLWIKENKEFRFNGHLYDVYRIKKQNGKIVCQCIDDIKETQLFASLDEDTYRGLNSSSSGKTLKYWFNQLRGMLPNPSSDLAFLNIEPHLKKLFFYIKSAYSSELKADSPPPIT